MFAWTRNPLYLVLWTMVLITNYLGVWVLTLVTFPALFLVVLLEEKELRQRFGQQYFDHCKRVPRFLPHRPAFRTSDP